MASALIAGGTGLVGGHLLLRLVGDPAWDKVVAVGRRAPALADPKLESRVVDLRLIEGERLPKVDQAFCCLGTTIRKAGGQAAFREVDFDQVLAFARAAKKAGARAFHLVTSSGADARSAFFYMRVKGEVEEGVRAVGFEALHIYRPGLLLGDRAESRPLERAFIVLTRALKPVLIGPLRSSAVEAAAVAGAMAGQAADPGRGIVVHAAKELAG